MCDGDIPHLKGVRPFDRMQSLATESNPTFKSTLTVWGANHDFFNSEWETPEGSYCVDHTALPAETAGSAAQRSVALAFVSAFFLANVGPAASLDRSGNRLFDPKIPLPASIVSTTLVDRGFMRTPDNRTTLRLEDFISPTGTSSFGRPNDASNVMVSHGAVPEHDPGLRGALLTWDVTADGGAPGASTYFQTNFTPVGQSISLSGYDTLDLRVDRAKNELNWVSPPIFPCSSSMQSNTPSTPIPISSRFLLIGPVGGPGGPHSMLQCVRIPLASFGMSLGAIRGVRLTFDRTPRGAIYVANIRATKLLGNVGFSIASQSGESEPIFPARRPSRRWPPQLPPGRSTRRR